jgi:glycosyltransferase involved in cell wall biosynthesis
MARGGELRRGAGMIVIDATPLQTEHRFRGPGTYTAGLLDALTRLPHPAPIGLLLQSPHPDDLPLAADLATRAGITITPLHRPRWRRDHLRWLLGLLAVKPALRRARPRIYHATEPDGVVLPPGVKTVATLYDLIPLRHPSAHFPPRRFDQRVGYARYLRLLQRADRLIAISDATRRDAVERLGIAPERIAVTPLAVDERRFYPRSLEEVEAGIGRYGLHRPYLLHVGASTYHKNTARIVQAFDLFSHESGVDHALYIAGQWIPKALAELDTSYAVLVQAGRLRVVGFVPDDLPALYGGAEALVYPSLIEGFGLPVLEAMRCGTPVLTSSTSSLPEVGGDAALYVDPYDVDAIAAALCKLASQPSLRADLSARGLQRAELFTWTHTAEQTLRVYEELL